MRIVMLSLPITTVLAAIFIAMWLDWLLGEPNWLYRRIAHPIVLIGRSITALEARWLDTNASALRQRLMGLCLVIVLACGAILLGWLIEVAALRLPISAMWLALPIAMLLAHRSLIDHVRDVADGLAGGIERGREQVARIVGRDPHALDSHGVARAAIESLAENLSDAVVAPLLWTLVGGLPGLLLYKTVNTLDSMVGYRNDRYRHFGWASARLDDVLNWAPARATALLLVSASLIFAKANARKAFRIVRRDASHHRSPNAGFPEAAMAGALGFKLSGPRAYHGGMTEQPWVGDGRSALGAEDIRSALRLANAAWALVLAGVSIAYLLAAIR